MHTRRSALICALTVVISLTLSGLPSSFAAPDPRLQQVRAQVRDLQMSAAAAGERAGAAQLRLAGISKNLSAIKRRADRELAAYRAASANVESLARDAYMSGGLDSTLQILMADDPTAFLNQAAVIGNLQQRQVTQMRRAQTAGLRVAQTQAEIADQETVARSVRDELAKAQAETDARVDQAQAVLADLEEADRQRLAQIEQDERARDVAAARALQEAQDSRPNQGGNDEPNASSDFNGDGDGGFVGGDRGQTAVNYALSQVGDRYSFSADPPSTWDCSKLTAAAWGKAGVGLTALSYTQWDQTRRVPVSDIRPGDLVFYFGQGAHHVAIYIGNGKMVSASNPSDGVEIIDFLGPWYGERFSGVGRVL
ncbi:MAG: NlpC/P60 family protein [Actinomycetota bacterium]|nr:NlpC/P60 family protein [Actinomycetota bacterium]